jgi:nucleoside-diphosphate-sugar epimerase
MAARSISDPALPGRLLIFGYGYSGAATARCALRAGWQVTATQRRAADAADGVAIVAFDGAAAAIADATHLLVTAPPGANGDPVLAVWETAIASAPHLRSICYLSTTGVYGDRGGGWVDETTAPAPQSPRAQRRREAEQQWAEFAGDRGVDLFRLAGIYGPGRSVLDDLHAGTARRVIAPDHCFGRIHVDDIAGAVLAAAARPPQGLRVLNGNDDEPAASADVIAYAAGLLGIEPPAGRPLAEAWAGMSEMARSFWVENRRVASRITQEVLRRPWRYPTYREGLNAILAAEAAQ